MSRKQSGFTLIELMIVVAIIGILGMIAIPAYQDYILRGRIAAITNALSADRVAMEQYYQDNRTYMSIGAFTTPCGGGSAANDFTTANFAVPYFTVTCVASATTYTITATGTAATQTAGFVFNINYQNLQQTTGLSPTWAAASASPVPLNCWVYKKGYTCN